MSFSKTDKMDVEKGEAEDGQPNLNWSEAVEDLVTAADTEGAISLLKKLVSKLESLSPSEVIDLQLASALTQLAKLYSSKDFSLQSDDLLTRASLIKQRTLHSRASDDAQRVKKDLNDNKVSKVDTAWTNSDSFHDGSPSDGNLEKSSDLSDDVSHNGNSEDGRLEKSLKSSNEASPHNGSSDDDWEAIADRAPNELLSTQCLPGVSNISLEDAKVQGPKRRGRGTFLYKKHEQYSEMQSETPLVDDKEIEDYSESKQQNTESRNSIYGTHHVLVLADFPPSTRTMELEKLFEDFRDRGVVIRWVNDTAALAVFRTASIALEARNCIRCLFTVRVLDEGDVLMGSISARDLEPPRQRPQTSARTAHRLIAQGMGLKLPSTFSSRELKNQEEARKNRIVTRQKMREDAWGGDD